MIEERKLEQKIFPCLDNGGKVEGMKIGCGTQTIFSPNFHSTYGENWEAKLSFQWALALMLFANDIILLTKSIEEINA